ncbi:MAG TPA: methylated-DNA--[protein]-cysteine S-methyltransferase [Conexibacter sp.]
METATIQTPPGPFTTVTDDGRVLASGWATDAGALLDQIGRARLPLVAAALEDGKVEVRDDLGPITQAVRNYLDGDLSAIDSVPVAAESAGPFRARAWQQLRAIKPGAPETYSQLAARSGNPRAIRAAGSACARNPAALFIPCHRVLRTGGALGGFLYGLDVKRWLLDHEAARVAVA